MLLTTAVGGLGLNLTAADTVIFLEHDWNPQKDLQAMDRAHRLGQRRAVNVYRLLVRGTLEEQVMSLQKFKLDVAAAVVNAENMSLQAMDTGNLLDLFALQEEDKKKKAAAGGGNGAGGSAASTAAAAVAGIGGAGNSGMAAVLAGLTDPAAAEAQYGEEFDLEAFKQRL
jgi:TATA-binding protein-associated factor